MGGFLILKDTNMRIGVIADTHDNMPKIKEAIDIFNREKVGLVIHLGDYIAPFSIKAFDKLKCSWMGIFGNNDGEKKGLKKASKGRIKKSPLKLTVKNRKIVVLHDLSKFHKNTKCNIVLFGHTHSPEIRQENKTLFLNPGECGGWLTHTSSIAIVDLEKLEPRIVRL